MENYEKEMIQNIVKDKEKFLINILTRMGVNPKMLECEEIRLKLLENTYFILADYRSDGRKFDIDDFSKYACNPKRKGNYSAGLLKVEDDGTVIVDNSESKDGKKEKMMIYPYKEDSIAMVERDIISAQECFSGEVKDIMLVKKTSLFGKNGKIYAGIEEMFDLNGSKLLEQPKGYLISRSIYDKEKKEFVREKLQERDITKRAGKKNIKNPFNNEEMKKSANVVPISKAKIINLFDNQDFPEAPGE